MDFVDATSTGGRAALNDRARALADTGQRRILGIAGPPGAGKSTLADRLVAALDGRAAASASPTSSAPRSPARPTSSASRSSPSAPGS
ncbi:hypothetical protein ABZ609_24970, partial [Streptomyces rubiginosohelvolus]